MKPLILFCSRTGNTARIAGAMAGACGAELAPAEEATRGLLAGRRLVGLASGIYWVRHDPSLFRAARMIPGKARVFVATTSGFQNRLLIKVYAFSLLRHLRARGHGQVPHWHCPGQDNSVDPFFARLGLSKGRPNSHDLESARTFAREVINANR